MPTIVAVPDSADGSVVELLSRTLLESHAGWLVYMRGVDYAAHDHVSDVAVTAGQVSGVVTGTRPYDVAIARTDDGLAFTCTCPMGETDDVCKHVVALGIELLGPVGPADDNDVAAPSVGGGSGTVFELDGGLDIDGPGAAVERRAWHVAADVEAWLADLPADRLRELVRAEAARDPDVHRRLSILAAADAGRRLDTTQLRASIVEAFSYGDYDRYGYVHYREAWDWANDVAAAIDELGEIADAGFAAETVPLIERRCSRGSMTPSNTSTTPTATSRRCSRWPRTCTCGPATRRAPTPSRWPAGC